MLEQVMEKSWNLQKVTGIAARLLKVVITRNTDKIRDPLTPNDLDFASWMLFAYSMSPTEAAMTKGSLTSLRPFVKGGVIYTRGRVGRSIEKLLGITGLPY